MIKRNGLSKFLFGDMDNLPLSRKIHILLSFITFFIVFIGSIINVLVGMNFWVTISTFLSAFICFAFYAFSRNDKYYQKSIIPFLILSVLFISVIWFLNAGYNGNVINFIFVLFVGMYSIVHKKIRTTVFFVFTSLLAILVTIQYLYPDLIIRYDNRQQRFVDILVGNILYVVFIFFIIRTILTSYEKENEIVLNMNRELVQKNEEIADNVKKLELAKEELIVAKEKAEESDRLKTSFLANMSHEIRTPMNGILGFAELLDNKNLSEKQIKKYVAIIQKSGKRMLGIINDLIDISKIESGQMKLSLTDVDILALLKEVYSFFKNEAKMKGVELELNYDPNLVDCEVLTDREKVYAVLTNLLKNAIKYSQKGTILICCEIKNEFLEFSVKDQGIGIPQDRQEFVFERFVQAFGVGDGNFEGAGLGLPIAKSHVEMMGGSIWFETEYGEGTTFSFTIKGEMIKKKRINELSSKDRIDIRKINVLIAEDDDNSAFLLTEMLTGLYNQIHMAGDGKMAIEIFRVHQDIDLVLMDIKLPKVNGLEAISEIRKFNKNVVIIAQTAYALTGDKEKAEEAGADYYISKPIQMEQLMDILKSSFNQ